MTEFLQAIPRVRQHAGDGRTRRWYTSAGADLYVFENDDGDVEAIEFCYGKPRHEHSLRWEVESGFSHSGIDDGEGTVFESRTPVAVGDGSFDAAAVAALFERVAVGIDPSTYRRVMRILHLGR